MGFLRRWAAKTAIKELYHVFYCVNASGSAESKDVFSDEYCLAFLYAMICFGLSERIFVSATHYDVQSSVGKFVIKMAYENRDGKNDFLILTNLNNFSLSSEVKEKASDDACRVCLASFHSHRESRDSLTREFGKKKFKHYRDELENSDFRQELIDDEGFFFLFAGIRHYVTRRLQIVESTG